jgi:hypothetical protein
MINIRLRKWSDQDQSDAIDLVQLALRTISEFPNFA